MNGQVDGSPLSVSAYPAAWRIEVVNDDIHRGFEYARSENDFNRRTRTLTNTYILAFIGEPRKWFGRYQVVQPQRLGVERYQRETVTKRFHPGGALG